MSREWIDDTLGDPIKGYPDFTDTHITLGGAVFIPPGMYLHPKAFIRLFGQDKFDELLKKPRLECEYDKWSTNVDEV